jgi:protein-L-isoaspartate(D-aspartate) O-methyltransferase
MHESSNDWRSMADAMVDRLIADGHVTDERVESAFRAVPRHRFMPDAPLEEAYGGDVVRTLGDGQDRSLSTASAVPLVARMLEELDAQPGQRILEIGCGTGYSAALTGHLVGPSGAVTGVDIEPGVIEQAHINLAAAGVDGIVRAHAGDGWDGFEPAAPFDSIIATVALNDIPPPWVAQLREDGTLVVPIWLGSKFTYSMKLTKRGSAFAGELFTRNWFLMLRGSHAGLGRAVAIDDDRVVFLRERSEEAIVEFERLFGSAAAAEQPAPEGVPGATAIWLALEDRNAIMIDSTMSGVFDVDIGGLAILDWPAKTVRGYGDRRTFDRFIELLQRAGPIPVRPDRTSGRMPDLSVCAAPHGTISRPTKGWLIEREHYDFAIAPRREETTWPEL